jgi:EAL and modified HD-GYP domain-containing signal transduction protein
VETPEQFRQAYQMGYSYFQGYFFARPVIISGRDIPAFKLHYLQILKEINLPELDYQRLENMIKQEVSLSYKLLRYINSAAFGWRGPIESIRQALVLLGETESRKFVSLVALPSLAQDKPEELVVTAVIRARFCESIAPRVGLSRRKADLFFLGMFSLLGVIMDRPLEEVLAEVGLAPDVREALLEKSCGRNPPGWILELVRSYEAAEWDRLAQAARHLRLPAEVIPDLYLDSVHWADSVFR